MDELIYTKATSSDEKKTSTILVVEADADLGSLLVSALEMETPSRVLLARDEKEALEMVEATIPGLLLFDAELPRTNGAELYEQLRTRQGLKQVPVLLIDPDEDYGHLTDASLYHLNKPFDLLKMLDLIHKLLA